MTIGTIILIGLIFAFFWKEEDRSDAQELKASLETDRVIEQINRS